MILPTKHVSARQSLLGVGAVVLAELDEPQTMTGIWERIRELPEVASFERLVLALDLLYTIGAVEMKDGLVRRVTE